MFKPTIGRLTLATTAVGAMIGFGCAHQPTSELVEARQAYQEAVNGPAQNKAPARVHDAYTALTKAERVHEDDPGSQDEKDFAYIAHRRAMIAKTAAEAEMAADDYKQSKELKDEVLLDQRDKAQTNLDRYQQKSMQDELQDERSRRGDAERLAEAAVKSLGELGQVKAEDERVIITLSNSIFFRTGQSQLLPLASEKLDKVAEVLKDQGSGKVITIMGHTDSKGSTQLNQRLSQERAEAVRNYLMQQGVPAAQIKAVGMGEERPVANNSTAEGRANNRRVEIVVDNGQGP